MTYAMGCRCHGATFCPDLICIGYDDDVPVYVRRDSSDGKAALASRQEAEEQHDRAEYARLRTKYEPPPADGGIERTEGCLKSNAE